MKGSDFVFDCVNLLHFKCHNINLNRAGSYTMNPVNDNDKCFQYAATVISNYEKIAK